MADKNNNAVVKKQNPNKKPNIFVRFGRRMKEAWSELKKVTWPDGKTIFRTTLVVLGVVAVFLVVLLVFDWVLGLGHDALLSPLTGQ